MLTLHRIAPDGTETEVGGIGLAVAPRDAHRHLSGLADGGYRVCRREYADAFLRVEAGKLRPARREEFAPKDAPEVVPPAPPGE